MLTGAALIVMVLVWALAAQQIVETWQKGTVFEPIRELMRFQQQALTAQIEERSYLLSEGQSIWKILSLKQTIWLGVLDLFSCGFCLVHWVAFCLVALFYVHNEGGTAIACAFAVVRLARVVHQLAKKLESGSSE